MKCLVIVWSGLSVEGVVILSSLLWYTSNPSLKPVHGHALILWLLGSFPSTAHRVTGIAQSNASARRREPHSIYATVVKEKRSSGAQLWGRTLRQNSLHVLPEKADWQTRDYHSCFRTAWPFRVSTLKLFVLAGMMKNTTTVTLLLCIWGGTENTVTSPSKDQKASGTGTASLETSVFLYHGRTPSSEPQNRSWCLSKTFLIEFQAVFVGNEYFHTIGHVK